MGEDGKMTNFGLVHHCLGALSGLITLAGLLDRGLLGLGRGVLRAGDGGCVGGWVGG